MPEPKLDLDALLAPFAPATAGKGTLEGQTLSGCAVERLLGRGAMGEVWLARRLSDGAAVVVKRIAPQLAADATVRARMQREWSALALVGRHPNVVGVQAVALESEVPHLVLDHVPGEALDRALARRGRLPAVEASRVARDLAAGLAAVHAQGLLHRDVKPANAILRPDGVAVLVDFGLAKDVFASSLTQAGSLLGTAAYMAPEQWADEGRADVRSDLFSLGVTLYQLATGELPFGGDDVAEIADRAAAGDYAPLADTLPGAPLELSALVDLLLDPEPRYRPGRALDVAADLQRVMAGQPCGAPALLLPGGRRAPLDRERRALGWTLGTDPTCHVVLPPGASPRHAQLRRDAHAFVLVDLRGSAGTWTAPPGASGPSKLEAPRALVHGERLLLGSVEVTFLEPLRPVAPGGEAPAGSAAEAFAQDVRRVTAPEPVARALAAATPRDARALAFLIELLGPPDVHDEASAARALAPLGPDVARAALERRRADAVRLGAWAQGALGPGEPGALRGSWIQSRAAHGLQLGPARPARAARLWVSEPGRAPREVPLGELGVVLVGRDARCHVPLALPGAPRLAATLVRLHRRWLVRDERGARQGASAAHAFEPDAELDLGGARLRLSVEDAPWPAARVLGQPAIPLDPATFEALEALGHPCVGPALVALLEDARRGWPWLPAASAAALAALDDAPVLLEASRAQLALRATSARARLGALLGRDPGDDPATWRALLSARATGPLVAPAGWLGPIGD